MKQRPDRPFRSRHKKILLTNEIIETIINGRKQKKTWKEIAKQLGHTTEWTRQTARENSIPTRRLK